MEFFLVTLGFLMREEAMERTEIIKKSIAFSNLHQLKEGTMTFDNVTNQM